MWEALNAVFQIPLTSTNWGETSKFLNINASVIKYLPISEYLFTDFHSLSLGEQRNHYGDQNVQHSVFRSERRLENDVGRC